MFAISRRFDKLGRGCLACYVHQQPIPSLESEDPDSRGYTLKELLENLASEEHQTLSEESRSPLSMSRSEKTE